MSNPMNHNRKVDRPLRALAWMSLSALGFSVMTIFVKILSDTTPHFQLVFFRSSVNLIIQLVIAYYLGQKIFPKSDKAILVFRGLAGFGSLTCFFYAITHLPVSVAAMLSGCSPVFVIVFSAVLLRERLTAVSLGLISVVFAGLVLLLRPEWNDSIPHFPILIGLLGAALGGMAYVAVRAATARVGVNLIILYFTGIATLLSAPMAWRSWVTPINLTQWACLVMVGLCASVGQFAMTQGYRFAQAGLVSMMGLLNAAYTAIFGWILFNEQLSSIQWAGMLIVAVGISALTLRVRPRLYTTSQKR